MDITVEFLKQRLTQLDNQKEQLLANINAVSGAGQEIRNMIAVLEKTEETEVK